MSRAFVKEPDGTEPEELPEREISSYRNLVTANGLKLIEKEIITLQKQIKAAEGGGDKTLISQLARDLRYWTARRASAELIPAQSETDKVLFGLEVTIEDDNDKKKKYRIVGQDEANPAKGLLSYVSPLAKSLIGKQVGDVIELGEGEAEIVAIQL